MIGTQIENYLIQAQLGEGGMGTVYRALETNLDRTVAIKVLNTDLARDPSIVERFRSEARAQANLNHTNIATLYAFLVFQGNPVMVMEYVEGDTFQQLVNRRGPLPSEEAVPLFRQALLGISAAHRMGIVHRDIKPSNLMLNRAGIVKVMDFGIAKVASSVNNLTRTGAQMGTVFYMSPEQVKGERVDIRSDIYSLGITLYELLTANVPFSASSEFQVLNDHVNTPPPPPSKFYPYLPKGLENIILKSLAKNPDERFQTAEEFGAALERPEAWEAHLPSTNTPLHATVLAGGRMNVSPPPATPPNAPPAASAVPPAALAPSALAPATPMPRKAIAAAVIILGLAGGGAYLYSRGKAPSPSSHPGVVSSGNTPRPSGEAGEPAASTDKLKPIASDASDADSSAPADSKLAARNAAVAAASAVRPAPQPAKPRETPARHDTANPPAPPPDVAAAPQQNVQTPAPAKPAASPVELDEGRQRFIRLRSKALSLKSSLGELRQRLASQGLSVNSDAVEAEGNMDSYMLEADRALQAGDVQTAGTNMDRAEHETKKISALFGR